ncbi:ribonuclease D [Nocardioides gansuensis]|uniref:Ribonuclease D n=1 Tax=Nocardioides gansuensis TaxID=2138300 RepID=A0A2T8F802_9ACTN|nr:HRDC domain-containing protein [Nocardioides gansuensis]PVG81829.1 ribonuclease D [Nocardioides gansuensis]
MSESEPLPLLTLRDGLPAVIDTAEGLAEASEALVAGEGPVSIDAERASGYRYSSRAYLIQLRREGSGSWLVDPIAFDSLAPLQEALEGSEWILHAATQDLPCLREVGLEPTRIFDTELAGRLLGYPRVGLASLVEGVLGMRLRKEHSAADWSTRPLPRPWLEYAALDVEVLLELRAHMAQELEAKGKTEWARQEFEHLLGFAPAVRSEPWRRMSGVHKLRGRRSLGAARALWQARDEIASRRDVSPGRIVPDSALVAAAAAMPTERQALLKTPGFHGRGAARYTSTWLRAIAEAAALPDDELPTRAPRQEGPPHPRMWADRDPVADRRFKAARAGLLALAAELELPVENLISPDTVRRVMWAPPATRDEADLLAGLGGQLADLGARPWQVELVAPVLVRAAIAGDVPPPEPPD